MLGTQTLTLPVDAVPRGPWLWLSLVPDILLLVCVVWLWRSLMRTHRVARRRLTEQLRTLHVDTSGHATEEEMARLLQDVAAERLRLRATLEGMIDPVAILEPMRNQDHRVVDFICLDVNPAACNWMKRDRGHLVGSRLRDMLPEAESSGLLRQLTDVMDTGRPLVMDDFPILLRGVDLRRLDVRGIRGDEWVSLVWRDVSGRHDVMEKLAASEEQFRLLAENSTDVILRLDTNDTIRWISPSLTPVLGWTPEDAIGHDGKEFLATPENREQYERDKARVLAGQGAVSRAQVRAAAGDIHWMEVHSFPFRTSQGTVNGMVASMHLIDAQVRMEQDLEYRARMDELTGLLNRREFLERLAAVITSREPTAGLVWCDIDGFKSINDAHGHAAGDAVLAALGERIRGCLPSPDDIGGRTGGDEMVVLLRGIGCLDAAVAFAEKLRHRVSEPIRANAESIRATISVGVTLARVGEGVDEMLARADDAMYAAKERGKDRVVAIPPPAVVTAVS